MAQTRKPPDVLVFIGEKVRKRRLELGLGQEQLGQLADLHRTYISDIERGQRNVSVVVLHRIAEALDAPIVYFLIPDDVYAFQTQKEQSG